MTCYLKLLVLVLTQELTAALLLTLCFCLQWNDSNMGDEAKANARDLKHTAEQKGREIRDSWR